jgi:hypothetical protein
MKSGNLATPIIAVLVGVFFVYLASFGPVVAKAGVFDGGWVNPVFRGYRNSFYLPVHWACEKSSLVRHTMGGYVGFCHSAFW